MVVNAVSTLDGKTSWKGKSSGIGSIVDRHTMRIIRARSDAVLVGAGTVRAEKVSLGVPEKLAQWRESQSKTRQPLGVILSRKGSVSKAALPEISQDSLILCENTVRDSEEISDTQGVKARDYLSFLRSEYDVRRLLVEGGPTINHMFFEERLVDELFLTLSPKLYGGQEDNLLRGRRLEGSPRPFELISTFLCGQELFLRYGTSFR